MQVIQATLNELSEVALLFDAYRQFYEQATDVAAAKDFLKARIENKESVIFLVKIGEEYAGFVQLYPIFSSVGMKRSLLLNDLYVSKLHRRKGVGEALIKAAQNFCETTNAGSLLLETTIDNTKAQQLYLKTGFVQSSTIFYYWSK